MKKQATFDSSFWAHAVYLDLTAFLLDDFELFCTPAVAQELGHDNPTSLKLKALLTDGRIGRATPRRETVARYGKGERAAINLALEKKWLLLIDDGKPYEAAQQVGVEVTPSLVYLVWLYDQDRIPVARVLESMAKMTQRGTIKPLWMKSALKMVAEIRERKSPKDGKSHAKA